MPVYHSTDGSSRHSTTVYLLNVALIVRFKQHHSCNYFNFLHQCFKVASNSEVCRVLLSSFVSVVVLIQIVYKGARVLPMLWNSIYRCTCTTNAVE